MATDSSDSAANSTELLTEEERNIVLVLGLVYQRMRAVVGRTATRDDDLREIRGYIHALQRMMMAQAAARAYPEKFRLLGESMWIVGDDEELAGGSAYSAD
jgi:hypothetical protein